MGAAQKLRLTLYRSRRVAGVYAQKSQPNCCLETAPTLTKHAASGVKRTERDRTGSARWFGPVGSLAFGAMKRSTPPSRKMSLRQHAPGLARQKDF